MNEAIETIMPSVHTLVGGLIALGARKGSHVHVVGGKLFLFTMILAVVSSLAIMKVRGFLPLAVVLSLAEVYLLPSAVLSIRGTSRRFRLWNALLMGLVGLLLAFTVAQFIRFGFVLGEFRAGPLALAVMFGFLLADDWSMLRSRPRQEHYWIRRHLVRMMLALAVAVVALAQIGTGLIASPEISVVLPLALAGLAIILSYRRYPLTR